MRNYYNFDTSDYAMFSVGEVYPALAEFAVTQVKGGKTKTGSLRRPHLRKSFRQLSGGAKAIGKGALGLGRLAGGAALSAGRYVGEKGLGAGKYVGGKALEYGGKGLDVVKANPKASAIAAGAGVAGAGGAYYLSRKKRRKRQ